MAGLECRWPYQDTVSTANSKDRFTQGRIITAHQQRKKERKKERRTK